MRLRSLRETEAATSLEDQLDELKAQHQQEEEAAHLTEEGSEQPHAEELREEQNELEELWQRTAAKDRVYRGAKQAIEDQERRFLVSLGLKCSTEDCSVEEGVLFYRGRKWVPDSDELRTAIISSAHDLLATGHPGRELTYKILARDYFQPGITNSIRRYIRNCDTCGRSKSQREGTQGLLKPLVIPTQVQKELFIDFVEGLPESDGITSLMVITDRLSKGTIFVPLPDIKTETVV